MIKLHFPLKINLFSPRPIFKARINNNITTCMLDTGADIPVFCKGIDLFEEWTEDVKGVEIFKNLSIGRIGKKLEHAVLYNIPIFQLSDNKNLIMYSNMKIAVMLKPQIPCDIILSSSLFMKMRYSIDCLNKEHSLKIEAERGTYGVGFYNRKETIYIFTDKTEKSISFC